MPGVYDISLTTLVARELIPDPIITPRCYGKYRQGWFFNAVTCDSQTATTWFDTECESDTKPKWWDDEDNCFGEYCMYWSWWATDKEGTQSLNPMRWFQTRRAEEFQKKWPTGVNAEPCEKELQSTFDILEQTTIKQIVVVSEIPPIANILPIASKIIGTTPFTIQLSPKKIKTGSFPIDKIVWDLGDGSPLLTITRYNKPTSNDFVFTNTFFDDIDDPRNYDIVHTFHRTKANYALFYPSLTCYSASTNTTDSCSITLGPVLFEQPTVPFNILTVNSTDKGELYGVDYKDSIGFVTTGKPTINQQISIPSSPVRQVADIKVRFFGNPGNNDYSLQYIPNCGNPFIPRPELDFLIREEAGPETPIMLEDDTLIYK